MPSVDSFTYAAEVTTVSGTALGMLPINLDLAPAMECGHWEGIRAGLLPPRLHPGPVSVEPWWHQDGPPYVEGLRVVFSGDTRSVSRTIPGCFFDAPVQRASAAWVSAGKLVPGESFSYRPCAFAKDRVPHPAVDEGFTVEAIEHPLPLQTVSLDPLVAVAQRRGGEAWRDQDMAVFIPRQVLDETKALAQTAGDVESGGILVGRLARDPRCHDLFIQISAQIPAHHARAQHTSLTFTAQTWKAVDAAIRLRDRGEQILGWYHSHPWFCRGCPEQNRRVCLLSRPFFSDDDRALHRTVFPKAFVVALLLSFIGAKEPRVDLFGWRGGLISTRGFYLVP